MKHNTMKWILSGILLGCSQILFAQNVILNSGTYDKDPYPGYNPNGEITGVYTVSISKDAYSFQPGQFTITVTFPPGAVYAGGGTLPAEFAVTAGSDGTNNVQISIVGAWTGAAPGTKTIQIPIKIVGPSEDQPTGTFVNWLDPFVTENTAGNSTGNPLNVENQLPVKLSSFAATVEAGTVRLKWETTEEVNASFFQIEHSLDARIWRAIGRRDAIGNSTGTTRYSFPHVDPASGTNYYRLKMVDVDGTFSFSTVEIARLFKAENVQARLYPNPAASLLTVETQDWSAVANVSILNAAGNKAYDSGSKPVRSIDVNHLAPGIYFLQVTNVNNAVTNLKVVIAR